MKMQPAPPKDTHTPRTRQIQHEFLITRRRIFLQMRHRINCSPVANFDIAVDTEKGILITTPSSIDSKSQDCIADMSMSSSSTPT